MTFQFFGHNEKEKSKSERTKLSVSFFSLSETLLEPKVWLLKHGELLKKF
jgi:hypothetical protein